MELDEQAETDADPAGFVSIEPEPEPEPASDSAPESVSSLKLRLVMTRSRRTSRSMVVCSGRSRPMSIPSLSQAGGAAGRSSGEWSARSGFQIGKQGFEEMNWRVRWREGFVRA